MLPCSAISALAALSPYCKSACSHCRTFTLTLVHPSGNPSLNIRKGRWHQCWGWNLRFGHCIYRSQPEAQHIVLEGIEYVVMSSASVAPPSLLAAEASHTFSSAAEWDWWVFLCSLMSATYTSPETIHTSLQPTSSLHG